MQIDTQGAIVLARFGRGFRWIWTQEGIARLCEATGWPPKELASAGPPYTLATDLSVNRPEARIRSDRRNSGLYGLLPGQSVMAVSVHVTDWTRSEDPESAGPITELELLSASIIDAFVELSQAITEAFGSPSESLPGAWPSLRWRFPEAVMVLRGRSGSVELGFENPAYVKWLDKDDFLDHDDEEEEGEEDNDDLPAASNRCVSWEHFSEELRLTLLRLECSEHGNSVIDVECDDDRYIQCSYNPRSEDWLESEGALALRITLPENPFGDDRYLSRPGCERSMIEAGWFRLVGDQCTLWSLQVDWPARYEIFGVVADKAVGALRGYFEFESPSQLRMKCW
ncbi:DUF6301 family protein [Nocardia sp. A7]|uniref:DUF6301 family protein n=1 Tax=Nocardia sp. A7 TaxID=2789274 RepID=UPI00397E3E8E